MSITFHIGYHKTATSWLQERIFPRHPQIRFIGLLEGRGFKEYPWLSDFLYCNELDFDEVFFHSRWEEIEKSSPLRSIVASGEDLSGNLWNRGIDSALLAHRIHRCCPDAKIVICLRHQLFMIESIYRQYVLEGGILPVTDFLSLASRNDLTFFSLDHLRYHRLVKLYCDLFSRERVHICLHEELRSDEVAFLRALFGFLGVDASLAGPLAADSSRVNVSPPPVAIQMVRCYNRILPIDRIDHHALRNRVRAHLLGLIDQISRLFPPGRQKLPGPPLQRICGMYRGSNELLERRYGLPVRKYDYPLPDEVSTGDRPVHTS